MSGTLLETTGYTELLDHTRRALTGGDVHDGIGRLRTVLGDMRARLPHAEWQAFAADARRHPVHELLLESPFTRRAYEKPRGYAGDAVLMDLIYGVRREPLSPLGGMLYAFEFDSPCFHSVRTRRAVIAREIDSVAVSRPGARVLSVASGHLREIEWSRAARARAVAITAVDQDRDSLACIAHDYHAYPVTTRAVTIGDLLRRSVRFPSIDLAYAAGLYDYLADDLGRVLTTVLFRMLAPGGRLLIANFTPATYDAAFMEAIMDWQLIYRTPAQLRALADAIRPDEIASDELFCDANRHVAYLRLVKR
jgi:hypothetical protein